MKKVFIFDFDGTFYSGERKFDKVKKDVDLNKRKFLSKLSDDEYELVCKENPKWFNVVTGKDIVKMLSELKKKYPNLDISIKDFCDWQNDFIYDVIIDYTQVVDSNFIKSLCESYPVYIVSNSSLKHINYYLNKLNISNNWFNEVIGNEFLEEDPSKKHYYKEIMNKENVDPHNVYVLGDSVDADLSPAINLGMNAFYINNANNIEIIVNSLINNEI